MGNLKFIIILGLDIELRQNGGKKAQAEKSKTFSQPDCASSRCPKEPRLHQEFWVYWLWHWHPLAPEDKITQVSRGKKKKENMLIFNDMFSS